MRVIAGVVLTYLLFVSFPAPAEDVAAPRHALRPVLWRIAFRSPSGR